MSNAEGKDFVPTCTSQIVQNLVMTSGFTKRSQIGLIRDAFDAIEDAHKNGFSYRTIEEELNRFGIPVTAGSLKNILRRIRIERKEPRNRGSPIRPAPAATVRPRPTAVVPAVEAKDFTRNTDRDPSELF